MKTNKTIEMIETVSHICEVGVNYSIKLKRGDRERIQKSQKAEQIFRQWYDRTGLIEQKEIFTAMFMTRSNDFIGIIKISEGNATSTIMDVKYLLRAAILCNASVIILCHNHPSGNLTASENDKTMTAKTKEAAKLMEIDVVDHVILAPDYGYLSMADENMMNN